MINTPTKCVPLFLHMHFLVWCCYLSVVAFCNMLHACKVHRNSFYCISVPCIIDSVCLCLCYWESSSVSVFQMWSICAPFSRQAQTLRSSPIWRSWTARRCLCRRYLRGPWSSLEYVSDSEVSCNLICCESLSVDCNSCSGSSAGSVWTAGRGSAAGDQFALPGQLRQVHTAFC